MKKLEKVKIRNGQQDAFLTNWVTWTGASNLVWGCSQRRLIRKKWSLKRNLKDKEALGRLARVRWGENVPGKRNYPKLGKGSQCFGGTARRLVWLKHENNYRDSGTFFGIFISWSETSYDFKDDNLKCRNARGRFSLYHIGGFQNTQ